MPSSTPTFGEMLEETGLLEDLTKGTRALIDSTVVGVNEFARVHLKVVSCNTCTEPKGCCKLKTGIYLHDALPVVARLRREGRDTPELRKQLKEAAHYMETVPKEQHVRPCVFLDADERCTVYEDRPVICGITLMSSPASDCNDPERQVSKLKIEANEALPAKFELEFRMRAGLRRTDRRYAGALPRMVLIALEAWDRQDYVSFIADRCLPATHRFEKMMGWA